MDLDVLGAWIDEYGGKVVGTLPLLASFLGEPFEPSPYSPVSRRFWNEVYLDLDRAARAGPLSAARARLDHPETQAEIAALRALPTFDLARQSRLVTSVLDDLTTSFFAQPVSERADFDRWVADNPLVIEYGRFRAAADRQRSGWHDWPSIQRNGLLLADDFDRRVAARHVYAQWSMHRQLGELSGALARPRPAALPRPAGGRERRRLRHLDRPGRLRLGGGGRRASRRLLRRRPELGLPARCAPTRRARRAIACWPSASATT